MIKSIMIMITFIADIMTSINFLFIKLSVSYIWLQTSSSENIVYYTLVICLITVNHKLKIINNRKNAHLTSV